MLTCRFFAHGPGEGAWNMAFDEALLESAAAEGIASLRFYEWSQPTLSLGYFQAAADRQQHPASSNCPLVRRASGGGAILHDRELTYSLAMPAADPSAGKAEALYFTVHEALAGALESLGIKTQLCRSARPRIGPEAFLCFRRRAIGDLLIGDVKIAGSAQRRQAILQHGSILMQASSFAPGVPGLEDITGGKISAENLLKLFRESLSSRLNKEWVQCAAEVALDWQARAIEREKFALANWTFRR